MKSRVWLEIDLEILRENFGAVQRMVSPAKVTGVLKANAYGLGVLPIAKTLKAAGIAGYAAAELREALTLTDLGLPVQILGTVLPDEIPETVANGIIPSVGSVAEALAISKEAVLQEKEVECCFIVDSGMGRLGMLSSDAEMVISEAVKLPNLLFKGIYSHFPVAYQSTTEITTAQIHRFKTMLKTLANDGIVFSKIHLANSDAINNYPVTCQPPFTHVRTGINLHGSFDPEGKRALSLRSILTLKTRLAAARMLPAGYTIGYGCTYHLPKATRVGTIAAGYADGFPLALSNRGYVLIRGIPCPILGRISMDYTTVDLSQVPDAVPGEEVVCLGGEGVNAISVEDWAALKGTHPYDIICSLGNRVERVYLHEKRDSVEK